MLSTLEIAPGSPVVEADIAARTHHGRTPVREALLRKVTTEHLDVIQTRRALEGLIAACSARRATALQRKDIVRCAERMLETAERGDLDDYMRADHALDLVNHQASHNRSAVQCVVPLIVQCRRFWYAYQHEGDVREGARAHMHLAEGIATGNEAHAVAGANQLMDYLERFARRIINQ